MNDISKTPMPFGKHKGKPFNEVPRSYLEWLDREKICREPLSLRISEYLRKPINWTEIEEPLDDDIPF